MESTQNITYFHPNLDDRQTAWVNAEVDIYELQQYPVGKGFGKKVEYHVSRAP